MYCRVQTAWPRSDEVVALKPCELLYHWTPPERIFQVWTCNVSSPRKTKDKRYQNALYLKPTKAKKFFSRFHRTGVTDKDHASV